MGRIKGSGIAGFNLISTKLSIVFINSFFGQIVFPSGEELTFNKVILLLFLLTLFWQIVFPSGGELTVAVNGNRKEFLNLWYRAAADDYLNSEGE